MSGTAASRYLSGAYGAEHPAWHDEHAAWKARHAIAMLRRHGIAPGRVAEIGCGAGGLLEALHAALPDAVCTGYDIAPEAIARAARRSVPGLRFAIGGIDAMPPDALELVLAIDVIEHVEDIYGFLRALRAKAAHVLFHIPLDLSAQAVLRPGGLLRARRRAGHLHHFTAATALALLDETGYRVVDWHYTRGGIEQPQPGLRGWTALPRRVFCLFGEGFAARALGGFSIIVLAKGVTGE